MTARRKLGALLLAALVYTALIRPRMLRRGATDAEVEAPYPGADLIPDGRRTTTMACTLNAPPADVWPWLVQMGCNRAGWYSWDRLDNGGVPSAEEIHPEWQQIEVGQHLDSVPNGRTWFEVAAVEPERFLALRAPLGLGGHPFDTSGPRPRTYSDSTWCFLLDELPDGRTRLVVSGYAAVRPLALQKVGDVLVWEPAHWIMQTRQFANLVRRAER